MQLVVRKCCPCDDDEMDSDCRCLCHVTSPQILLTAKEYVEDTSLQVWHNAMWHLYRQPDTGLFALVHTPSCEFQLGNAPADFIIALCGDDQGVAHTSDACKDCLEPFLDEHPTLAEWYLKLKAEDR